MKFARRSSLYFTAVFLAVLVALTVRPSGGALAKADLAGSYAKFIHAANPEKAPNVPFFDAVGKKYTLADFRGKVVLVNIWATWCPACIVEMPLLDRLQARLGGKDFMVLTISQDGGGAAVVKRFLDKRKLVNLPVFIDKDRKLGMAFKQDLLPTSMLLDARGRELGRIIGPAEWDSPKAIAFLRRYLPAGGK
jgi:thiol-disulfide isomerase/thioredoxin